MKKVLDVSKTIGTWLKDLVIPGLICLILFFVMMKVANAEEAVTIDEPTAAVVQIEGSEPEPVEEKSLAQKILDSAKDAYDSFMDDSSDVPAPVEEATPEESAEVETDSVPKQS